MENRTHKICEGCGKKRLMRWFALEHPSDPLCHERRNSCNRCDGGYKKAVKRSELDHPRIAFNEIAEKMAAPLFAAAKREAIEQRQNLENFMQFHFREEQEAKLRRRYKRGVTPRWANENEIKKIYKRAAQMTEQTGVPHEVDHIIPVKGKRVTGLHVENNLQILTAEENRRKHNKFSIDKN